METKENLELLKLHEHSSRGNVIALRDVLNKHSDLINVKGNLGNSALHWAASGIKISLFSLNLKNHSNLYFRIVYRYETLTLEYKMKCHDHKYLKFCN